MANFAFLEEKYPELARMGTLAERYVYSDANSCLMKLGMLAETIVNQMFWQDDIPLPMENNAANRIRVLAREGLLPRDLVDALHLLRKRRNDATHEALDDTATAKALLPVAYRVASWFYETYGDWHYVSRPFVMPANAPEPAPAAAAPQQAAPEQPKAAEPQAAAKPAAPSKASANDEDKEEARLLREAEKRAKAAAPKPRAARAKQAQVALNQRPKTEKETRLLIDEALRAVGWAADTESLRYARGARPAKGRDQAIAEWPTESKSGTGHVDYALFHGERLVATIEAKSLEKDIPAVLDGQCAEYSSHIRPEDAPFLLPGAPWGKYQVPFTFATNGRPYLEQYKEKSGIWFRDLRDPSLAPRALSGWVSPAGIDELLAKDLRAADDRLRREKEDYLTDPQGLALRPYQKRAVEAVEQAVLDGRRRILLAMATGTGKTRTILAMMYRFLKTNRFRRILFLVDRTTLGDQALDVFRDVRLEELMPLSKIYNIKGLKEAGIDPETRVSVATVQSMVRRLDGLEETMPSVTDFDLILIDEAHRGYGLDRELDEEEALYADQRAYQSCYRAVLDYFDAVKIALTATPALQTTELFGAPIYTYSYREAVIEGYLVDYDAPHIIRTRLSTEGIHYRKGEQVTTYDTATGEINLAELPDELDFDVDAFNRQVITEDFNRTVLTEIAKNLDPESPDLSGKTLIYAANDAHADLIVRLLKEIFSDTGVSGDAIVKITGKACGGNKKKIDDLISRFKNEPYPSIAVTVDLLTTGIDVPKITTLVFLRRVKSRILYEQMLGRATRLCPEIHKEKFDIYDAVGLYDALEDVTNMKPVVKNPKATVKDLLDSLEKATTAREQDYFAGQLRAALQRKKRRLTEEEEAQVRDLAGESLTSLLKRLETMEPEEAAKLLLEKKTALLYLGQPKEGGGRPLVVSDAKDELTAHDRSFGKGEERPEDYLEAFTRYIKDHQNEIAALRLIVTRPASLTLSALKSLRLTLDREGFTTERLNTAVAAAEHVAKGEQEDAADIITLVRRYAIGSRLMSRRERVEHAMTRLRQGHTFTKQEQNWLRRIEKYLLQQSVIQRETFDEDDRFRRDGGFSRIDKVFDGRLEGLLAQLNEYLYDDGGTSA